MNTIPDYVTIAERTYHGGIGFGRWGNERITIGKWCSISQGVKMLAGGNHRTDAVSTYPFDTLLTQVASKPTEDRSYDKANGDIVVGNDVWIGYAASLCGSMTIGHGAVIAANATVFTDIPPYAIAVGNPARVTKYRFDEATIEALLRIAWWDWSEGLVRERVDALYLPIQEFIAKYHTSSICPFCARAVLTEPFAIDERRGFVFKPHLLSDTGTRCCGSNHIAESEMLCSA